MRSDKASVTVLTQALALFFLSNFFLRFLIGLLLVLPSDWENPGNSPCFQCFFLTTGEELEAVFEGGGEIAQRVIRKVETLGLVWVLMHLGWGIGEGTMEEEKVRETEAISIA